MADRCPRCEGERGDSRWCATCGLDSTPTAATLPTPEAMEAGMRERAWFDAHPEAQRRHEEAVEAAARNREETSYAYLSSTRPPSYADYSDLRWQDRLTRLGLLVVVLGSVTSAAFDIWHLSILGNTAAGDYLDSFDVADSQSRLLAAELITAAAYFVTACFFIAWMWRAYKNVAALGAQHLRFGFGWAIGGWFVPILSFWRPKQIADDIWRTSDPEGSAHFRKANWSEAAVPALLNVWWAGVLVMWVLERISGDFSDAATLGGERSATVLSLVSSIATVVAGGLAIELVRRITERQRARAAAIGELPARGGEAPPAELTVAPAGAWFG